MFATLLLSTLFGVVLSGRAPYLGGDMQQYIEMSKKPSPVVRSNQPVTPQQLENYKTYQSKFSDIAKAYSEGYKAAIKAIQNRATIARQRVQAVRSSIPHPSGTHTEKTITTIFRNPAPNNVAVTGTERSGIPVDPISERRLITRSVDIMDDGSKGFSKLPSTMLTDEQRIEISKLNAAAMKRNHYMDTLGVNSYTGGGVVLSKQDWTLKKHKRSEDSVPLLINRQRRSRMPYLGQNLDKLGVVRVVPNWDSKPVKKNDVPEETATNQLINNQPSIAFVSKPVPAPDMSFINKKTQIPSATLMQQEQEQQTVYSNPTQQAQRNNVFGSYATTQFQQPQQYQYQVPYSAFFQPSYTNNMVENTPKKEQEVIRTKKNASPEPTVAEMNYAARHRNVYLDSFSGDPYTGGSAVLSRQYVVRT